MVSVSTSELTALCEEWSLGFRVGGAMLVQGSGVRNFLEINAPFWYYPGNLLSQDINRLKKGF